MADTKISALPAAGSALATHEYAVAEAGASKKVTAAQLNTYLLSVNPALPIGAIFMWSGTLGGSDGHRPMVGGSAIEAFHLCNGDLVGAVQTPDLRNFFIVGAGDTYAVGATGGALTHTHIIADHSHTQAAFTGDIVPGFQYITNDGGSGAGYDLVRVTAGGVSHAHVDGQPTADATLTPSTVDHKPPYTALYYLMRVS
jgi:hypothetical protein